MPYSPLFNIVLPGPQEHEHTLPYPARNLAADLHPSLFYTLYYGSQDFFRIESLELL
jgi:hypothetical protein